MKSKVKSFVVLFVFGGLSSFSHAQEKLIKSRTDNSDWVSAADLNYDKPEARSEEGMPVGNGRMGSLVWTSPAALKFQINRVDIFGNNTASNNFYERNTDYCGGAGFVDVDFAGYEDDVFTTKNYKQHLSCRDGVVTTEGEGIKTRTLVWNDQDVMAIEVNDSRKSPSTISINLRMLRSPVVKTGNHTAISKIGIRDNRIVLTQVFKEDDYYCSSALVIGISGRDVKPVLENETTVKLIAKPGNEPFTIYISSAASFKPAEDVTAEAFGELDKALLKNFEGIYQSNLAWWNNFWDKGYVHLHSSDGEADFIEQNYAYFLYVMASSSRGSLPPKFNGMLWTTGGDARKWGNLYWGANQSCLYNGLFPTNRMELMDPLFNLYNEIKPSLELAAQEQWGSRGIYIPEVVGIGGLPKLPSNFISEIQGLYLNKKPWSSRSDSFYRYASTKMSYLSRWNWKKDEGWKDGVWNFTDKGAGPFGHVTHIFSRGAKIAYQYWQRYEYTRDTAWLRNYAYPMLKGVAEFYRNFPNVKKESDGK
ncbi:MAG: DUF5703 domain-containing protein, partial [Bacteroidota bacterium]|nr:DUF5703 domain-containing protein [Bacteroidota bacterium]